MAGHEDARAQSYDPQVAFCFEFMPDKTGTPPVDNPYRKQAILVVHGIGNHKDGPTAVVLRDGFENALCELRNENASLREDRSWIKFPTTYITEGYWGDYGKFADCFPALWKQMSPASRNYFSLLWETRSASVVRTAYWFAGQVFLLPFYVLFDWADWYGHHGVFAFLKQLLFRCFRFVVYLAVMFVTWLILLVFILFPWGRSILASVMGDVRSYVSPKGPVEHAIVQRIDGKIRDLFLRLLGVGPDFNPLPDPGTVPAGTPVKVEIAGKPHTFDEVIWVAHSLGTVVSYNAISDILHKCKTLRESAANMTDANEKAALEAKVRRVERGLHRFYTLGSPLRKIFWMFPGVLRDWPHEYLHDHILEKMSPQEPGGWWINFRHIWDPVSGNITPAAFFREARDCHSSKIFAFPGYAHVQYWNTDSICRFLIAQAQPTMPGSANIKLPIWPQWRIVKLFWQFSFLAIFGLVSWTLLCAAGQAGVYGGGMLIIGLRFFWNWLIHCETHTVQHLSHWTLWLWHLLNKS